MLDIFRNDAFGLVSLTEAINIVPYRPRRIGSMGIFSTKTPRTNVIGIERKGDVLSLIPSKPRGSGETTKKATSRRDMIPIYTPHLPLDDSVYAEDLSGIREMGTEDQLVTASSVVNEKLAALRQDHELTHEYQRVCALQGKLIDADADATELLNMFDAFNLTQYEVYFDLEGTGDAIKAVCMDIIQYIEDVLGGETYTYIHAIVGNTFFQNLISNEEVKGAYNEQTNYRWATVQQGSGTQGRGTNQVTFGDITFENYRGKVGSRNFVEADEANFFPMGTTDLFQHHFGPADTMDDVNMPGRQVYAMQKMKDWNVGVDLHSESNPLALCKRPKVLVKGYSGVSSS